MTQEASREALPRLYRNRFSGNEGYRDLVWRLLARKFFARWVPADAIVLDLGAGYGEFINNVHAGRKYAMDLNPDSRERVSADTTFFLHDCATRWPLADDALDIAFSSNFFEHLPDKAALLATLREAWRCLRPGGRLIALGPNIRYLNGRYWDYFDHHIALSDASLSEALALSGFELEVVVPRFLPYTMVGRRQFPLFVLRAYLAMPWAWRIFGKQFLIVARKAGA